MLKLLPILYVVSLLMDMSVAGLTFAISRRAAELNAGSVELGLLGAAWFGPYLIVSLVAGRLSDRWGRRRVAIVGPLITCAMTFACAWTTNVPVLIGLTAVFGFGLGFFWAPVMAWISDGAQGTELHRRLTCFGMAWNTGLFLGFALTGWVFRRWPSAAFGIPAIAMLAIPVLLLLAKQAVEVGKAAVPATPLPRPQAGRGFRKTAWLANFSVQLATNGVAAIFPQLATHLGIHAGLHGAFLSAGRVAAFVTIIGLQLLVFWRTRLWPLWVAQGVCALAAVAVAGVDARWLLLLAFVVMGATTGYTYQASIFFTLDEMAEKGKGTGLHEAFLAAGLLSGPLLAGWAGNNCGLRAPYLTCSALLALLVGGQIMLVWQRRRGPTPA